MIADIMKILKNLFGNGSKIHADEIIVGNQTSHEVLTEYLRFNAPVNLPLQNGWSGNLQCSKNGMGQVRIYGEIFSGTKTAGTTIAFLPEEYRPPYVTSIPAQSSGINIGGLVGFAVTTSGNFNIYGSAVNDVGNLPVRINYIYQT